MNDTLGGGDGFSSHGIEQQKSSAITFTSQSAWDNTTADFDKNFAFDVSLKVMLFFYV